MKKHSLSKIGFLQGTGIAAYCALVGYVLANGNNWFGDMNKSFGPMLVLSILVVSVLICALLAFGIPAQMFWDKKNAKDATVVVTYTAGWLVVYILLSMIYLAFK